MINIIFWLGTGIIVISLGNKFGTEIGWAIIGAILIVTSVVAALAGSQK